MAWTGFGGKADRNSDGSYGSIRGGDQSGSIGGGSVSYSWSSTKPGSVSIGGVTTPGGWVRSESRGSGGNGGGSGGNGGGFTVGGTTYKTQKEAEAAVKAAAKAKAEATAAETGRAQRAQTLAQQLTLNQQRAASDVSPQRAQAAQAAVSAIQAELNALAKPSLAYMQQYQQDQLKTIEQVAAGGKITAATGTKVDSTTQTTNQATAAADVAHPTVGSVLAAMGQGFAKGFMSGGVITGLAGMVGAGVGASGALQGLSLVGTDQTGQRVGTESMRPGVTSAGGPAGQQLANGQVVGTTNGGSSRPTMSGTINTLAPGFSASGGQSSGTGASTAVQTNEQAYNQYLGLLAQREKANSLSTNAGWMGGSGTSLLGRWAATAGGRGGASGTEYSPLATAPQSLYR